MTYVIQLASLNTGVCYATATTTEQDRQRDALFKSVARTKNFPRFPYSRCELALDVVLDTCGMESKPTDVFTLQGYGLHGYGGYDTPKGPFNWHRDFLPVFEHKDKKTGQSLYVPIYNEQRGRKFLIKRLPWLPTWPLYSKLFSQQMIDVIFEMCGYKIPLSNHELDFFDFLSQKITEYKQNHPELFNNPAKQKHFMETTNNNIDRMYGRHLEEKRNSEKHIPPEVLRACLDTEEITPDNSNTSPPILAPTKCPDFNKNSELSPCNSEVD